jgi:hypothetical protein
MCFECRVGACEHLTAWFFGVMGVVAVEQLTVRIISSTRIFLKSNIGVCTFRKALG